MAFPQLNRSSVFPPFPTDKQVFVDSEFVRWVYSEKIKLWEPGGTVDSIPLATLSTEGYMSRQQKKALDSVPTAGGGFGIIVDPKTILRTDTNPDGVIQGPIELRSDSLDIICVDSNKEKDEACSTVVSCGVQDTDPPGLLFKPKDLFLETLIIDHTGQVGPRGERGYRGPQGDHGFSKGPIGNKGTKGTDINTPCVLNDIKFVDKPGIAEEAIVNLKMLDNEGHGCKMIVTTAKLDLPGDRPADKVIATLLSRSVVYPADPTPKACDLTRLDDWTLAQPGGDETPLDMQVLRLAKGSNDRDEEPIGFNGTMSLSEFVGGVVAEYKARLEKIDKAWGKEVKEYIEDVDDKARTILSTLANDLAMCEFNLPAMEFCITFECTPPA